MATLIRGKDVAEKVLAEAKAEVDAMLAEGVLPCLAVILVGDDPASRVYVNKKKEKCAELGIRSLEYKLPAETSQEELLALIDTLNHDASVHGILCQLPLPGHLDEQVTVRAVAREREYLADASAVNITRYPEGMIDALKKLQSHSQPMKNQNSAAASMYINNPLRKGFFDNLFSTHPPLEKRIERLENGKWSF